jgi:hypothetical protein
MSGSDPPRFRIERFSKFSTGYTFEILSDHKKVSRGSLRCSKALVIKAHDQIRVSQRIGAARSRRSPELK